MISCWGTIWVTGNCRGNSPQQRDSDGPLDLAARVSTCPPPTFGSRVFGQLVGATQVHWLSTVRWYAAFFIEKKCNAGKNFTLILPETFSGVEVTFPDRGTFLGCFYTKETDGCCDCLRSWKGEQVHRISGLRSWNVLIYNVCFIVFYHGMFLNQCIFILNVSIMLAKICKDVPQTDDSHMHKFDCGVYEHHVKIWSKPREPFLSQNILLRVILPIRNISKIRKI